jgi:hypothetical protein
LQDKTLNGSNLLGSFSSAVTGSASLWGGTFTVTEDSSDTFGTWSFTAPTVGSYLAPTEVEINSGSNWFFIALTAGTTSGDWSTCPGGLGSNPCLHNPPDNAEQALSHIAFFDGVATPVPAALPLFATGLGALGLLGWRRKRKNVAAIAAA